MGAEILVRRRAFVAELRVSPALNNRGWLVEGVRGRGRWWCFASLRRRQLTPFESR